MGVTFLASFGVTIILGFGLHLLTNAVPKLTRIAVAKAARRLPILIKANQEAAWLADLANLETHFEMLRCAIACWVTSYGVRLPFALEESHRDLIRARVRLNTHGAIVYFALGRLVAWDTPANASEWGLCEKWCIGAIFASKKPIEQCMKDYLMCLERDLEQRPRQYENQEEAAKEVLMPIAREMKIFQFLRDHVPEIDISPAAQAAGQERGS